MKLNNDGSITQTLDKEINEIGNFILFMRSNKLRVFYFKLDKEKNAWSFNKFKPFDTQEIIDKWHKSDRYNYLKGL